MQVTIFGPNLNSGAEKKGTLHVHAEDCGDCAHYGPGRKFGGEDNGWTVSADSRQAVVFDVYPPGQFEYDESDWRDYESDLYFAPCVKSLPPVSTEGS